MLNISKQIYAGWNTITPTNHLYENEVIPKGESVTEQRKLEKFVLKYSNHAEYNNVPLPGFTLYNVNKKNYSAADSTWLVIDPRGFLVRITQNNLANILKVSGITEGLIQQKCVWAREDSETTLSLVPISSALYAEAVSNTELIESKVSMQDVQIGDTVLLQNNMTGTYMGVLSLYCPMSYLNKNAGMKVRSFLRQEVVEVSTGKFYHNADAKILKILNRAVTPKTREESVKYINDSIKNYPYVSFSSWNSFTIYPGHRGNVKLVSVHAAPKVKIHIEDITINEAILLFSECNTNSDKGCLVVESDNGEQFLVNLPIWGSKANIDSFGVQPIKSITDDRILFPVIDTNNSKASYVLSGNTTIKPSYSLDNFKKFYKIVKSVKNDTYI